MEFLNLIISIASVIISGFISWLVTFLYFKKANRNDALATIVPQVYILNSYAVCDHLEEEYRKIIQLYQLKYLKDGEKECLFNLYRYCYDVCKQPKSYCMAISVRDFFVESSSSVTPTLLLGNNLDVDNLILEEYDASKLRDILDNEFQNYLKYQFELFDKGCITKEIEEGINFVLNGYFFGKQKYDFFKKLSLKDILEQSFTMKIYNDSLNRYYEECKRFDKMFEKEITYTMRTSIRESEGIH